MERIILHLPALEAHCMNNAHIITPPFYSSFLQIITKLDVIFILE